MIPRRCIPWHVLRYVRDMKKFIVLGILTAISLQTNIAQAGCMDIYKKYAERRDKVQDYLVAGTVLVATIPAVGFWAGISPVLGVVYVAGDGALAYGSKEAGFGHKLLPNAFEKVSHILDTSDISTPSIPRHDKDIANFYKSTQKAYYRAIEKAMLKGKVPRNEQPLPMDELSELITEKLKEADSQNFFCKVRGQRRDGSDKHELYTPKAIRDVVVAAILSEEHGVDRIGVNLALHELKKRLQGTKSTESPESLE